MRGVGLGFGMLDWAFGQIGGKFRWKIDCKDGVLFGSVLGFSLICFLSCVMSYNQARKVQGFFEYGCFIRRCLIWLVSLGYYKERFYWMNWWLPANWIRLRLFDIKNRAKGRS